jgi:hypothetical protein
MKQFGNRWRHALTGVCITDCLASFANIYDELCSFNWQVGKMAVMLSMS